MKHKSILLSAVLFGFLACSQPEELTGDQLKITGVWINQQVNENTFTYQRAESLKENDYCFSVNPDGKFMERKNSGFCGTPPISYADYEGSWTFTDSILHISVPYWGGNSSYKWKVVSVDETHISVVNLEQVFENMN
jgi:hypothetical protein